MARRKAPPFPPKGESADQREERGARIQELMERAQRHQRLADKHLQEAERLKANGTPGPRKKR